MMDDKWRTTKCSSCSGYGLISAPMSWYGFYECNNCGESGVVWLRPKGHAFQYPGGPACGMWTPEEYEKAKPEMPYHWHAWANSEEEIDNFITDRMGSFDENLNTVTCMCGFIGTIKEHDTHAKEAEEQFILERRGHGRVA